MSNLPHQLGLLLVGSSLTLLAAGRVPQHPVDLNAATATELMELPRVGARTAARILVLTVDGIENPQTDLRKATWPANLQQKMRIR